MVCCPIGDTQAVIPGDGRYENMAKIPGHHQARSSRCQVGPTYVCLTFGTFVCTTCSGLHREFSHKVKAGKRGGAKGARCPERCGKRCGKYMVNICLMMVLVNIWFINFDGVTGLFNGFPARKMGLPNSW